MEAKYEESFEKVAQLYSSSRPGYPDSIYANIAQYLPDRKALEILEIGAGDGKATLEINNKFNAHIIAVEPGEGLCSILKAKIRDCRNIAAIKCKFEDFETRDRFDCIIAASAFHWIDKEIKFKKAAGLLGPDGILAAYCHHFSRIKDKGIDEGIGRIYHSLFPEDEAATDDDAARRKRIDAYREEFSANEFFELVSHVEVVVNKEYSAKGYIDLQASFSNNSTRYDQRLREFYDEAEGYIRKNGDKVVIPIWTSLEIGKKRASRGS
jgi:SAM-dependent methyltransferase